MYLTPRTDAVKAGECWITFARQLERELAELNFAFGNRDVVIETLKGDVKTLREQSDKLVMALQQVATAASVHSTRAHIIEIAQKAWLEVKV